MTLTRGKLNQQSDEFTDSVINLLKNDSVKKLISEIIKPEILILNETIANLRAEVKNLRESNIDLVRLLTEGSEPLNKKITFKEVVENSTNVNEKQNNNKKFIDNERPDKKTKNVVDIGRDKIVNATNKSVSATQTDTESSKVVSKPQPAIIQKRHSTKRVYGSASPPTATSQGGHSLSAVARKVWLYVGRATPGTSATEINDYLVKKFPNNEFNVEHLPKWKNAFSECFKVGADHELLPELYKSETWPKGLLVKKYTFFRENQ